MQRLIEAGFITMGDLWPTLTLSVQKALAERELSLSSIAPISSKRIRHGSNADACARLTWAR